MRVIAPRLCSANDDDGCCAGFGAKKGSVGVRGRLERCARACVLGKHTTHLTRALSTSSCDDEQRECCVWLRSQKGRCSWRTRLERRARARACVLGKHTTHLTRVRALQSSCDEPENKRMSDCCYTYEIRWLIYGVIRSACPLIHNSGRSNTWSVEATKTVAKYEKDCEPQRFCILYHMSNAHCALLPTYDTNA